MGIFNIHPDGMSTVTCSMSENDTCNYQVSPTSLKFNEGKREEMIYAEAKRGGSVRGTKAGLVPINFRMIVIGSTQANAIANARTVREALSNPRGGYIEYRPIGLDSAMSTYYHYLPSKPPEPDSYAPFEEVRMKRYGQHGPAERRDPSVVLNCEVMTEAWATSDPDSPVTVKTQATLDNRDDATHDNFVIIQDSDIKGDVLFPIVQVIRNGHGIGRVIMYVRAMRVGSNDNLDWIEGEDYDDGGWVSTVVDATASDGGYMRGTGSTVTAWFYLPAMDSTYIGKITPIIICRTTDSDTDFNAQLSFLNLGDGVTTDTLDESKIVAIEGISPNAWSLRDDFGEMDLPGFGIPKNITDNSTPTIADFIKGTGSLGVTVSWEFNRTAGSGNIEVDAFVLARANDWIADIRAESADTHIHDNGDYLEINSMADSVYVMESAGTQMLFFYNKYGSPLNQLMLRGGMDYRLRFITSAATYIKWLSCAPSAQFDVKIMGIYGTIYPFEVS